jgi:hypothetical protein
MQRGYGFGIWEEFCCRTWRVSRCSGSFPPLSTLGASLNGKALSDYNMDGIIETAGSELCGEGMALESGRSFVAVHGVFLGKARSDFDIIILDGTTVRVRVKIPMVTTIDSCITLLLFNCSKGRISFEVKI